MGEWMGETVHAAPPAFFTPFPAAGLGHDLHSDASGALLGPESSGDVKLQKPDTVEGIFQALDGSVFGRGVEWEVWKSAPPQTVRRLHQTQP